MCLFLILLALGQVYGAFRWIWRRIRRKEGI